MDSHIDPLSDPGLRRGRLLPHGAKEERGRG